MVRLQLQILLIINNDIYGSQFHYGSITTKEKKECLTVEFLKSQFHYGSITTYFNLLFSFSNSRGLNSTMVRLQLLRGVYSSTIVLSSQFHYGSITTRKCRPC